jgi:hypothetical protein
VEVGSDESTVAAAWRADADAALVSVDSRLREKLLERFFCTEKLELPIAVPAVELTERFFGLGDEAVLDLERA